MELWNLFFSHFIRVSEFSRNRLVTVHEPPGDTYVCTHFSGFHHEPPGGRGVTRQATYIAQPSFGYFDIFVPFVMLP